MIVLAFLVLITVMAVAFFTSTSGEATASKVESESLSVRQLADSSVQYILSHIRNATSGGTTTAWASQPGAIRTYGTDGNPESVFKLYSAASMEESVPASGWNPSSDQPGATWSADKALWTDLNAPVASGNRTVFPIIDPRAAAAPSGKSHPMVDGFSYNATAMPGAVLPTSTDDANARVPMPVRWLYVLKDGRFIAPSGGNGTTANFSGSDPKPTTTNPIVGRVAFWTDDETCKLNLNTACGGNYWDVPSFTAGIELHFSRYKPIKNEFARYPGHPATTSLAPALWSFGGLSSPNTSLFPTMNPPLDYRYSNTGDTAASVATADVTPSLSSSAKNFLQNCLKLNPRNEWGGSAMGSQATVLGKNETDPVQPLDGDRLFASIDEILYGMPSSSDMPSSSGNRTRPANPFNLAPADIDKLRFFLTTHSRAPDTNPLNQPKVGIWPIPENPAKRTPTDKLIAFCSTLDGTSYYFTRNNSSSSTADWTTRNDKVFDYLDSSLQENIPGFGGSLGTRYGVTGTRRILTQIYDYIRGSVNLTDTYSATHPSRFDLNAPYAFVPPLLAVSDTGDGQVAPILIQKEGLTYKGHGRFVTLKQAALQFIAVAANQPPCLIHTTGNLTGLPIGAPNATAVAPFAGTINEMHPWVGAPGIPTITGAGDGTWTIDAANSHPILDSATINNSTASVPKQTHAGLPLLSNKWISSQAIYNAAGNATDPMVALRNACINPRYHGSAALYTAAGAREGLDDPSPVAAAGKLGPHQTLIQAAILIDPFLVNPGTPPYEGKYQVVIKGLDQFTANGTNLGFPAQVAQTSYPNPKTIGLEQPSFISISTDARYSTLPKGVGFNQKLTFVSKRVIVGPGSDNGATFPFTGGEITIEFRTEPAGDPTLASNLGDLIQTIHLEFPDSTFPTPILPPMPYGNATATGQDNRGGGPGQLLSSNTSISGVALLPPSSMLTFDGSSALSQNPNFGVGETVFLDTKSKTRASFSDSDFRDSYILPERMTSPAIDERGKLTCDTIRSVEILYGDARVSSALPVVGKNFFAPHIYYHDTSMRSAHTLRLGSSGGWTSGNFRGATDHMLSNAILSNATFSYIDASDALAKAYRGEPAGSSAKMKSLGAQPHDGKIGVTRIYNVGSTFPLVTSSVDFNDATFHSIWSNGGDFNTESALLLDGAFIGKANESGTMFRFTTGNYDARNTNPDFNFENFEFALENLNNSPSRQITSPLIFGSLPVGATPSESWRTLLFSPNPNSKTHVALSEVNSAGQPPTAGKAPDYLLLDYFNMPVVEPYAISEPFSTAGRVNMNYRMVPFSHIRRDTALRGVLGSGMVTAVEDSKAPFYKKYNTRYALNATYRTFLQNTGHWAFRYPIHIEETLKQFDQRFSNGDIFRSPAEICSIWLYPGRQPTATAPENPSIALVNWDPASNNIKSWWYDNPGGTRKSITGDNIRERPYSTLYPRLTTKSNTYTVHHRVQTLQKAPGGSATVWDESKDKVGAEYRGSALVERYIDPSDPNIPDFTLPANADKSMDGFYRFRILQTKRFAP